MNPLLSTDAFPWNAFRRLSSLSIHLASQQTDSFFQALTGMQHLTRLDFTAVKERDKQAFAECISSLTGLRSLTLWKEESSSIIVEITNHLILSPEITDHLTLLTRLTQLSLGSISETQSLRFPTGIVDLKLRSVQGLPPSLAKSIVPLRNLTTLKIQNLCVFDLHMVARTLSRHPEIEYSSFANQLITDCVLTSNNFLNVLGSLTGLTKLHLESRKRMDPYIVCPRLSCLSNLRALKIYSFWDFKKGGIGLPQLSLPKLRVFVLRVRDIDTNECRKMWKACPCLKEILLRGKRLTR